MASTFPLLHLLIFLFLLLLFTATSVRPEPAFYSTHFEEYSLARSPVDPDEFRSASDIIESRGFMVQTHYVTTYDGYILALHRIVNPFYKYYGKPVILQHGLIASSTDFIINAPGEDVFEKMVNVTQGRNLGFVLSRLGYDVWLSNSRGNTYCRNHTHYDPGKDGKFWEYTWDEHALIDLPSTIDYVLNVTGRSKVGYIGHSQGTLIMFALLSTKGKYNELVKPFIALAPVAVLTHVRSPIKYLANNPILIDYFRWRGGEFLPSTEYIKSLSDKVCDSPTYRYLCSNLLFLFAGFDLPQLNVTRLPVYLSHTPAGTSSWNMIHLAQGISSGKVQMYNFGKLGNLMKYGQEEPPEYMLEKITNRYIAFMSGANDWLADLKDVQLLKQRLKVPLVYDYIVENTSWNHLDFIWGLDAGKLINSKICKLLAAYA